MTKLLTYIKYATLCMLVAMFFACQQPGGNTTGSEYMPDMAHSVAYEANYYKYYYHNTWGTEDEYYKYAKPREPVAGTIPRGFAGEALSGKKNPLRHEVLSIRKNGSVPFYYGSSEEGRAAAMSEVINNPYPITDSGLARGKELYEIFCGICHGSKGDGAGYLVRDDGGKYPVQPANLLLPEYVSASNGQYYHTIMHGKGKMGAYKDKIGYEERWQVLHYIRSLQAKELKLDYNQLSNTLNDVEIPVGASYSTVVESDMDHVDDHAMEEEYQDSDGHGVSDDHNKDHH
jgi:mono/diheme cytochrome c family protein